MPTTESALAKVQRTAEEYEGYRVLAEETRADRDRAIRAAAAQGCAHGEISAAAWWISRDELQEVLDAG